MYICPAYLVEEIDVSDIINASGFVVETVKKQVETGEKDSEGNPIFEEVETKQYSIGFDSLFK